MATLHKYFSRQHHPHHHHITWLPWFSWPSPSPQCPPGVVWEQRNGGWSCSSCGSAGKVDCCCQVWCHLISSLLLLLLSLQWQKKCFLTDCQLSGMTPQATGWADTLPMWGPLEGGRSTEHWQHKTNWKEVAQRTQPTANPLEECSSNVAPRKLKVAPSRSLVYINQTLFLI